jgi:hypothetical protein
LKSVVHQPHGNDAIRGLVIDTDGMRGGTNKTVVRHQQTIVAGRQPVFAVPDYYEVCVVACVSLEELISRDRRNPAIGQVNPEAARAGVADAGIGLPIVNLAVRDGRSESPALNIVPDELAAKQAVAYREAPGVADVKGVLEDSRIGIAVVLEGAVATCVGIRLARSPVG